MNPSGRFVYAADFISQTVTAFSINQTSGALTPITGSPFPVGGNPDQVTVDPSGRFVYVANDGAVGPSGAGVLAVDPNTGALTPALGSPFAAGKSPSGVTPNANTGFLYVANENSNNVSVFSINPATGVLTEIAGSPFAMPWVFGVVGSSSLRYREPASRRLLIAATGASSSGRMR